MSRDYTRAEILDIIENQATARGIPPEDFLRFAYIETGGKFDEKASRGPAGAKGLFQFVPGTAAQYGIEGREFDPVANTEAAARLYIDNRRSIVRSHEMTGRPYLSGGQEPNGLDMYLAHQQGAGGYRSIQSALADGHFSRRNTRALLLNNVGARDFKAVTDQNYDDFIRTGDQDMAHAFVNYWSRKFDRIQIPEKNIEAVHEARDKLDRAVSRDDGIHLRAAHDLTVKYDEVRYGFGRKALSSGKIDCSGWAVEMINATFSEVNEKSGRKIFSDSERYSPTMDAASSIVRKSVQQSGILLEGRDVTKETLLEGMVIGEDNGTKGWDKGRYKGIDHIVFVLRDPTSGELMISQSRGGEGVEMLPLDDYLTHKNKSGAKLYASDPLVDCRSLLHSRKDMEQAPAGDALRRANEILDALTHEFSVPRYAGDSLGSTFSLGQRLRPEQSTEIRGGSPLLSDPGHPDYALFFAPSYDHLKQLGRKLAFESESAYVNAAATLSLEAKSNGLKRIDHVILSADGNGIFAVQGRIHDPANHWIQVDKTRAASQSVHMSSLHANAGRLETREEPSIGEPRIAMMR